MHTIRPGRAAERGACLSEFHGNFMLVLHTHLPWVMYHEGLEEEWLYEATAETYIPLLDMIGKLADEGISPRITFTVSPVLAEQWRLDHFAERFRLYCDAKVRHAKRDAAEFDREDEGHLKYLAEHWVQYYSTIRDRFASDYDADLAGAFARHQREGRIELMTCGATHAYFPSLCEDTSIQAQVRIAVESHERNFGAPPNGLWLPECGYRPACEWAPPLGEKKGEIPYKRKGVEEFLSEAGLKYFIVDNHQLMKAHPQDFSKDPFFGYWAKGPQEPRGPVAVLARDIPLSLQVWRHEIGYPGDGVYMDFHKKHAEGRLRYWKITHNKADMAYKDFYYPDDIDPKIKEHAGHYKYIIAQSLKAHHEQTGTASMALTAFDTELFGHWWFEGPQFLYHVIKWVEQDPELSTETCSEFIERIPPRGDVYLPESSWGAGYDSSTWINEEVAWVADKEYDAEREMQQMAAEFFSASDPEMVKILQQCARELMLLSASDWKFMITNWSTRDHAERRVIQHYNDFKRLALMAKDYGRGNQVNQSEWYFLGDCMMRNRIFPELDFKWFAGLEFPPL